MVAEPVTTSLKAVRVRKPRPPAPPPLTSRLDDASGVMLEKSLVMLRKRVKAMRLKPQRVVMPIWVVSPGEGAKSPIVREEHAETPGTPYYNYALSLLELSDVYLQTQPLRIPKHSWMLAISTGDKSMKLVEGVATSHEEARERVEACWRIAMHAIADG